MLKIKKIVLLLMASFLAIGIWFTNVNALTINYGEPIIAIDGNNDSDVTISLANFSTIPLGYQFGYYLNGSSAFVPFALTNTFEGGNILDIAIYDGLTYYSLSGDLSNNLYSVLMDFSVPVTTGLPQQPADWASDYFKNVTMQWNLPSTTIFSVNFTASGVNDGIAPVPEPSTLLLLGSGLIGVGLYRWRRIKKK